MSVLTKLSAEDRLDIMELLVRYGRMLDTKDAAGYASLFAPDAVRVTGNGAKVPKRNPRSRAPVLSVPTRHEQAAGHAPIPKEREHEQG